MRRLLHSSLACLWLLAWSAHAEEELVDGIAAQVGTDIVLVSEVVDLVAPNERRLRAAGAPEAEIAKLRANGLETMIERRLVEKVVRELDLQATDAEVDGAIGSIAQENGLGLEQLKRSVVSQGMPYDAYRAEIKHELERRKVVNAVVGSRVHVEDEDLRKLYKEQFADQPREGTTVHLRQILIAANQEVGATSAMACDFLTQLREKILQGASFEDAAQAYSAAAPQQGGDIGWLHVDSMAGWMVELVEPLAEGDVSATQELPFGCTMVKLLERKEWKPIAYEQAKPMLQTAVYETKLSEQYREWMEELRRSTFIERRGYFADAAQFTSDEERTQFESSLDGYDILGGGAEDQATP